MGRFYSSDIGLIYSLSIHHTKLNRAICFFSLLRLLFCPGNLRITYGIRIISCSSSSLVAASFLPSPLQNPLLRNTRCASKRSIYCSGDGGGVGRDAHEQELSTRICANLHRNFFQVTYLKKLLNGIVLFVQNEETGTL